MAFPRCVQRMNIDITPETNEIAPVRAKLKILMEERVKKGEKALQELPKIQKVPHVLLQDPKYYEKYYEPKWVSIGPIHHCKPKLKLAEEQYKLKLVAKFIDGGRESDDALYGKIMKNIEKLKSCFHEEVIKNYDDENLGWMLFLDGCFVLQFIHSFANCGELKRLFKIKNDQIVFAQRDFFLLENQIPFLVLKLLMESREDRHQLKCSIKKFIRSYVNAPLENSDECLEVDMDDLTSQVPPHLLDLLRLEFLPPSSKVKASDGGEQSISCIPVTLPSRSPKITQGKDIQKDDHERRQTFRSVQALKTAWINLKPSSTCSVKNIKFSPLGIKFHPLGIAARLELPPVLVKNSMAPKFLNLIAYEMCPDNTETKYEITSYISFLYSLIDYANDVKELRSADILHNRLGCDDDVSKLFNEIAKDLVPNDEIYKEVIGQIEKHYREKWMTWMAQVCYDHFSTPWTVLAFLAAILALAMSGLQTWFTVNLGK